MIGRLRCSPFSPHMHSSHRLHGESSAHMCTATLIKTWFPVNNIHSFFEFTVECCEIHLKSPITVLFHWAAPSLPPVFPCLSLFLPQYGLMKANTLLLCFLATDCSIWITKDKNRLLWCLYQVPSGSGYPAVEGVEEEGSEDDGRAQCVPLKYSKGATKT